MNRKRLLATIAGLTALLVAGLPLAQQQQDDTAAAPDDQVKSGSTATQTEAAQDTAAIKPAPAKPDDSPFDYRSSEEISEDLPVSFPVDI